VRNVPKACLYVKIIDERLVQLGLKGPFYIGYQ
jgi:hypothetical protein